MNAVDLASERVPVHKNGFWRNRHAAPTIADRAEALIRQRMHCRNADIRVQFDPSTSALTLRGVVSSYYQKQLAQEVVRHLEEVSQVINRLEVRELASRHYVGGKRDTTATRETDGESS